MIINRDDNITGVKSTESAKVQLSNMIGMQSVKDVLEAYDVRNKQSTANLKYLTTSRLSPNLPLPEKKDEMIHFVLTGNPGTGKTTVAKLLGQMFYEMGYLESGHVVEVNRSQLIGEYIGQTAIKTADYIQKAMGGVLFIDEAYALIRSNQDYFGQEAIDTLMKAMVQYKGKFIVVASGYPKEMGAFLDSNPGLQIRFTEKIHIEDYTAEEMYEILLFHAKKNSVRFSNELLQKLPNFCENWVKSANENWGNAREAVVLINHMIRNWKKDADAKSIVEDGQTIGILEEKHIPETLLDNLRPAEERCAEVIAKLNAMIGLEEVKQTFEKLRLCMISGDMENPGHYLFTGNPGTGKTTVAKLLGQMFYEMRYLSSGHLITVHPTQLIGEYIGQTGMKTANYIKKAMGGVLFIDEAYALIRSNQDYFGQEAIDTLVEAMDLYKDKFIVVMSGYPKEMDDFLDSNPGLQSRINEEIHIEDYTAEEMYEILLFHVTKNSFRFSDELLQKLPNFCENWINSANENWGNAREAVVLINHMIRNWKKDADAKSIVEDGQTIGILEEKHISETLLDNL